MLNTFTKPTTRVFGEDDILPRNTSLFNARLESCQREKKIVATKSLQMVAAVICNQVHLCRSQVDFLNYQYVNVEQNVIFQFRFNSNRLNFIEVEEIESEMCADKSFRTVVAAT